MVVEERDAKSAMARCGIRKEEKKQRQRRMWPLPVRMLLACQSTAEPNVGVALLRFGRCVFVGTGWRCVAALDACPLLPLLRGKKWGKSAGLFAFWSVKCENAPSRTSARPQPKRVNSSGRAAPSVPKARRALIRSMKHHGQPRLDRRFDHRHGAHTLSAPHC